MEWDLAGAQFFRALRAGRSQGEWARLLGYRSNVACAWEAGRRFPTAEQTLAFCRKLGTDATGALATFAPDHATLLDGDSVRLAVWLDALRVSMSIAAVARSGGFSRHAVARWLSGRASGERVIVNLQLVSWPR